MLQWHIFFYKEKQMQDYLSTEAIKLLILKFKHTLIHSIHEIYYFFIFSKNCVQVAHPSAQIHPVKFILCNRFKQKNTLTICATDQLVIRLQVISRLCRLCSSLDSPDP